MIAGAICVVLVSLLFSLLPRVIGPRLAPVLQRKIVAIVSAHFASPVRLASLQVQYRDGLLVQASGLQVQSVLHGVAGDPSHPMLQVKHFEFRTGLLALLTPAPRVHDVSARGVLLELPPLAAQGHADDQARGVTLDSATVNDVRVVFQSGDAKRASLVFDFPHGAFRDIRPGKAFHYDLTVDNGTPIGLTETSGTIGPWNYDDPRQNTVSGQFAFLNKDVGLVRGLHGHLTLHGTYAGTVARMRAEGTTDDPDFGLDVSSHTVALHTHFVLQMDTVESVTHLERLDAHFLHTSFHCNGDVTKDRATGGYNLDLRLQVPDGRMEDALVLAARTRSPLLRGRLLLDGSMQMPAGPEPVSRKLWFPPSRFRLSDAVFSDTEVQQQLNGMSERAQGHPHDADAQHASGAHFDAEGRVSLKDAVLTLQQVRMTLPGAQAMTSGRYDLDSTAFEVNGSVHTEASASHMTTGLESLIARPFNGLFSHGHTGATLPLKISGKSDQVRFEVRLPGGKQIDAPGEHQ